MRQSFIRKPGTEQVLVRIGIGKDGVFKVDGVDNKVRYIVSMVSCCVLPEFKRSCNEQYIKNTRCLLHNWMAVPF